MKITSPAFAMNQTIPTRYTGEGADVSPPLQWSGIPDGCREFAILCEDPDAPRRLGMDPPFVHWLAFNIPANITLLPEGLPHRNRISAPVSVDQGVNSFGNIGYNGPNPPAGHGMHHYHFILYALDAELGLHPGANKDELRKAVSGHVIEVTRLTGTFERMAEGEVRKVS